MKHSLLLVVLGAVLAVAMVGCGDEGGKRSDGGGDSAAVSPGEGDAGVGEDGGDGKSEADGPLETIARMRKAQLDGDGAAYAACFDADADRKAYLAHTCVSMKIGQDYNDAMIKEYGQDAVSEREREQAAELRDPEWRSKYTVGQVDEERATLTGTRGEETFPVILVKKNGAWLMPAPPWPPKEDFAQSIRYAECGMKVNKAAMAKIGKPDYSAERIKREASDEMREATSWMK